MRTIEYILYILRNNYVYISLLLYRRMALYSFELKGIWTRVLRVARDGLKENDVLTYIEWTISVRY